MSPRGTRAYQTPAAAKSAGENVLGKAPFVVLSHPKWREYAWVEVSAWAARSKLAMAAGIKIVEVVS